MISLFVFLGNVGEGYAGNRHNAAWQFADSLPSLLSLSWKKKFQGVYAASEERADGDAQKKFFLKPHTFMNNSGASAGEMARFYRIAPRDILVVHDELELPLGCVSLKWAGGLGGHNGLRGIEAAFGTRDFWRLRLGIGRPEHDDVALYVLSDFLPRERETVEKVFPLAGVLFDALLREEPESLLGEWAKKKIPELSPT
jgi:PTH1 family peptidyl-tRNA hydrolase